MLTSVIVLTFTYFAFTFLGPWQLNKGEQKSEFNHRLEAAMEKDPVPASEVLPGDGSSAGVEKEWTHVELQGSFVPGAEVLLRNRPVHSSPAFQVLTPFHTDDGQTILVNRGWAQPVNGADVPEIPEAPSDPVKVTGYIRMSEAESATAPIQSQGHTQVSGIHTPTIGEIQKDELKAADATKSQQKSPLTTEYVQLDEASLASVNEQDASPENLNPIPLPQLDNGPHLSYGIQWITFGIAAPAALIWFAYSEIRERRREREEIAEAEARRPAARKNSEPSSSPGSSADSSSTSATSGSSSVSDANAPEPTAAEEEVREKSAERKLADRYGGTRSRFEERRSQKRGERF